MIPQRSRPPLQWFEMLKKKPYRAPATIPTMAKTGATYLTTVMADGLALKTLSTITPYIMPKRARTPNGRKPDPPSRSRLAFEGGGSVSPWLPSASEPTTQLGLVSVLLDACQDPSPTAPLRRKCFTTVVAAMGVGAYSNRIMYNTPVGIRVLNGAQRRLFVESLATIVEQWVVGDDAYVSGAIGGLQGNQKVSALHTATRALLMAKKRMLGVGDTWPFARPLGSRDGDGAHAAPSARP